MNLPIFIQLFEDAQFSFLFWSPPFGRLIRFLYYFQNGRIPTFIKKQRVARLIRENRAKTRFPSWFWKTRRKTITTTERHTWRYSRTPLQRGHRRDSMQASSSSHFPRGFIAIPKLWANDSDFAVDDHRLNPPRRDYVDLYEDPRPSSATFDRTTQLLLWELGTVAAAEDHQTHHLLPVIVRYRDLPP